MYFTVKIVEFDTDATDVTDSIMTPKNIPMSGSTFPQTTTVTIAPDDVEETVTPGDYFYDLKVLDAAGSIYLVDSGTFTLTASPNNRAAG